MTLLGERDLQSLMRNVMRQTEADQVEVVAYGGTSSLTRFANNYIHQNVQESSTQLRVRAVLGKKIGIATTDDLSDTALTAVARRAVDIARLQQDNDDFVSLPGPAPVADVPARLPQTAEYDPAQRAAVVGAICQAAARANLVSAGAFRTGDGEMAVMNSLGVWAYHNDATADINTVVMGETSSGYAERWTLDVNEIDGDALAAEAIDKCVRSANPHELEPGEYDVILEEYAVADLMDYFAYLAFGSRAFVEKRSFMAGRIGEKVMGDNVSIWDDGLSPAGIPSPFDWEGVPRKRVDFIDRGIARGVVWDSYEATQHNVENTGHALPAGETFGPIPGNMFMAPGDATKEEMLASTKRGIWVSRFWYTRPVHPLTVVLTGMTRDGTFLIEDGKIVAPVHNLRFTQSYLEAMNHVEAIGRDWKLLSGFGGSCRVPALKIHNWNFTGSSTAIPD
jgi:predicted Zn-dependent protease